MRMPTRERRMSRGVMVFVLVLSAVSGAGASGDELLMNQEDDSSPANCEVFGATINNDGSALSGVLIALSGDGINLKTVSGTDGSFRFSSVPPGSYALVFKVKARKKVKLEITLSTGDLDLGKIAIE